MAVDAAVAGAESVPKSVGHGLSHKIGPLPVWGWIAVLVVGGAAAWFAYNAYQQAQGGGSGAGVLTGTPFTGGNGTPDTSGGTTTTTPTATLTNAQWVNNIASQVAAATALPLSQVELYLNEYLAGTPTTGNSGAVTAFNNVIQSALQIGGAPPGGTPTLNVNSNPFSSNATYLNDLLTYLPSGTSQSIINEINNLFNGTTTTISQGAADALSQAQTVVGTGPTNITYTITGSTPPTVAPTIGNDIITAFQAWIPSAANNGNNYNFFVPYFQTLGLSTTQGTYVTQQINGFYNLTRQFPTTAQIQQWINQAYSANPAPAPYSPGPQAPNAPGPGLTTLPPT